MIKPMQHTINYVPGTFEGSAIYIPSKQSIVVIGGTKIEWKLYPDLWLFSLATQKCRKLKNIQFEGFGFGAVLTSNERYIVLLGGANDTTDPAGEVYDIFVFDMKGSDDSKWKLKRSSIKCPAKGYCGAVRTGGIDSRDEILVIGFIKDCFKQKGFEHIQLPPLYIMKMIAQWYSAEMIHWLSWRDNAEHYGIYLKNILSAV